MRRFTSLSHVPSETRRLLRTRFSRYLLSQAHLVARPESSTTLRDEVALDLFLHLRLDCANSIDTGRAGYEKNAANAAGELSWDDLVTAGWIRPVWSRFYSAFDVARTVEESKMPALAALLRERHNRTYATVQDDSDSQDIIQLRTAIVQGTLQPRDVQCQSPEWVVARLWDRNQARKDDPNGTLRAWIDNWAQLGFPVLIPKRAWSEADAKIFHETTIGIIRAEPTIIGWEKARVNFIKQLALAGRQQFAAFEGYIAPVPKTLIDRVLWLDMPILEHSLQDSLSACSDIFGAAGLLLADVEAQDHSKAPHETFKELFDLALERPEFLYSLLLKARRSPALLADLALFPPTSVLACLLIAQWRSPHNAWDREISAQDDIALKAKAFEDAMAVLGQFIEDNSVHPEELSALLTWLHSTAQPGFVDEIVDRELLLNTLRTELFALSQDKLVRMLNSLSDDSDGLTLGNPIFAAALDVLALVDLENIGNPVLIVEAYIQSIEAGHYSLSAHRVGTQNAAALYALAKRTPAEMSRRFLRPLDLATQLDKAKEGDENPYTLAGDIALSLRTHMRVLCRVIVGCEEGIPSELTDALVESVHAGISTKIITTLQTEPVPVAVFSPRHDNAYVTKLDRPIAADIRKFRMRSATESDITKAVRSSPTSRGYFPAELRP